MPQTTQDGQPKKRVSSTKGRHIVQVNPSAVQARNQYDGKAYAGRKKGKAPAGGATRTGQVKDETEGSTEAGGSVVQGLPGQSGFVPLPPPDAFLPVGYSAQRAGPYDAPSSATFLSQQSAGNALPPLPYVPTPPLSYTSSASPDDSTFAYSPPHEPATVPSAPASASVYDASSSSFPRPLPPLGGSVSFPSSSLPCATLSGGAAGVGAGIYPPHQRSSSGHGVPPSVAAADASAYVVAQYSQRSQQEQYSTYALPLQLPPIDPYGYPAYPAPRKHGEAAPPAHQLPPSVTYISASHQHPSAVTGYGTPLHYHRPAPPPAYYRSSPALYAQPQPPAPSSLSGGYPSRAPTPASVAADPTFSLPLHDDPSSSAVAAPRSMTNSRGGAPLYLPLPSPSAGVYGAQQGKQTPTPGFADVDSWLRGLAIP
ncbi:hypothetical protein JCM10213_007502 [Rhodosporidiobolus nylandii]